MKQPETAVHESAEGFIGLELTASASDSDKFF
jgi:hypothetical protein